MILVIDTAEKEAKIGLVLDNKVEHEFWLGHRELSATILVKLEELYKKFNQQFSDTKGVIVNAGPGSFTGLRIGISIANSFAYGLNIPIVGIDHSKDFEDLISQGIKKLDTKTTFEKSVEPVYGAEPNITKPKK